MIPEIEYHRFSRLEDALRFLSENPDSKIIAGGTDLLVQLRARKINVKKLVDIYNIGELRYISEDSGEVKIGALTTIEELKNSKIVEKYVQPLHIASRSFATWQVRNIATIGGNLCNTSPAADTAPPLIVAGARLRLKSIRRERIVPIEEFFRGPGQTILNPDEVLVEVNIPKHSGQWFFNFMKLGRRVSHILSIVNVAVAVKLDGGRIEDVKIALGSVAPTPIRAKSVEEYLKNREATLENIEKSSLEVVKDIKPISDVRASAEYRIEMSKVMVKRCLREALKL
ncbi:MAG: FAD binding domain-containing protein [Nitrososphaerota archaeon]